MLSAWWQPTVSGKGPAYGEPVILAKSQRDAVARAEQAGHDPKDFAS
jgi:hypothetical protein